MEPIEASMGGTLRTILILVAVWWILRMLLRSKGNSQQGPSTHSTRQYEQRAKGEVRIETVPPPESRARTSNGSITDAEFEEIN